MAVKGVVFDVTSGKGEWIGFMNPYFWGAWHPPDGGGEGGIAGQVFPHTHTPTPGT